MGHYDDALAFLKRVEQPDRSPAPRRRLGPKEIGKLCREHPGVPQDYLDYMAEVGYGSFRESQFMIYSGLTTLRATFGDGVLVAEPGVRFLGFGDNFGGDASGFLPDEKWVVAEWWHEDGTYYRTKQTFGRYIRACMLMGPNGGDLRRGKR